jgi:hypothetical protein
MNISSEARRNRILQTAAWLYVLPRIWIGVLLLATLGLAAFLVILSIAIHTLHRIGA